LNILKIMMSYENEGFDSESLGRGSNPIGSHTPPTHHQGIPVTTSGAMNEDLKKHLLKLSIDFLSVKDMRVSA
jgi:hypothetical protein